MYTFTGIVASGVSYGVCTPKQLSILLNAPIEDIERALVHLVKIKNVVKPLPMFNFFVKGPAQTLETGCRARQQFRPSTLRKRLKRRQRQWPTAVQHETGR